MRKFAVLLLAALVIATIASLRWTAAPVEERLVRIQAQSAFPDMARALADEPIDVLGTLIAYRDDKVLLLKAQAAVLEHPRLARRILPLYGPEPEFREILRQHGASVLLPIDYFLENEVGMLTARAYAARTAAAAKAAAARLWGSRPPSSEDPATSVRAHDEPLTPEQRGWYAVHFVRAEGHDFLGQFAMDVEGRTQWIQTERFLEGMNWLLASGVRELETKARTDERIDAADIGWAALDAAAFVGATWLLRAGKATTATARSAKAASVAGRASGYAPRLAKAARAGLETLRLAKWPALLATAWVVVRHPSLVGDMLAGAATWLGLPVLPVQVLGWTVILLPVLLLTGWIAWMTVRVARAMLRGAADGARTRRYEQEA